MRTVITPPRVMLGKLPVKKDERLIPLKAVLRQKAKLPTEWSFDKSNPGIPLHMYGNDQYGDCVMAARANQEVRFELTETKKLLTITEKEVVNEYFRESGGVDSGLVMSDSLKAWHTLGWTAGGKRLYIDGYTGINPKSRDEIMQAAYAKIGVPIGLALPQSAMDQFDAGKPWTLVKGPSGEPGSLGGHCVLVDGWDKKYVLLMTWQRIIQATWEFLAACCDEAYGVIDSTDKQSVKRLIDTDELARLQQKAAA